MHASIGVMASCGASHIRVAIEVPRSPLTTLWGKQKRCSWHPYKTRRPHQTPETYILAHISDILSAFRCPRLPSWTCMCYPPAP
jgi:hypothetical protein